LAKAGKKYYAVLKNSIYQTISFVKESIIEDVLIIIVRSSKIHFSKNHKLIYNRNRIRYTIPLTMKLSL